MTDSIRIGFIANEIQDHAPPEFQNLIGRRPDGLLNMDYSRLTAVLWSVVQQQDARLTALGG
jgi:hypothetical protein